MIRVFCTFCQKKMFLEVLKDHKFTCVSCKKVNLRDMRSAFQVDVKIVNDAPVEE